MRAALVASVALAACQFTLPKTILDTAATCTDPGFADLDDDGFGSGSATCYRPGIAVDGDCDDGDEHVHPGAGERCNGRDDDCDPSTGEVVQIGEFGYPSIEEALDAATAGQVVEVCDGTWDVVGLDVTVPLVLTSASNDPDAVVLDGGGRGSVIRVDGGVLYLQAVTIRHGQGDVLGPYTYEPTNYEYSPYTYSYGVGGAVNAYNGAVNVERCTFEENEADTWGGAIAGSDVAVFDSRFADNRSGFLGGAIYATGNLTVERSTFEQNGTVADGGAIYAEGTASVLDSAFTANTSDVGSGGAIEAQELTLAGSSFDGNSARNFGGAIEAERASLASSTFDANSATFDGGAFTSWGGASIDQCSFTGNSAEESGGAVFSGSDLALTGCRFEDNSAGEAGAVWISSGEVTADADTRFTGNVAAGFGSSDGGAVWVGSGSWRGGAFDANVAGERGGAIYSAGADVSEVIIDGNEARSGGGIAFAERYGQFGDLADSAISGNTASDSGGGVALLGVSNRLERITIEDNTAPSGGGLWVSGSDVTVRDSELVGNVADPGSGGGLLLETGSTAAVETTDFDSNEPDDVYQAESGRTYTFGLDATFACTDADGCL